MDTPNLTHIVDTYVPISDLNLDSYLDQVRRDVLIPIRKLQSDGLLRWYSFLIHGPDQLGGREPLDDKQYIHLRLEPNLGMDVDEFKAKLPGHFRKPTRDTLANIGGLNSRVLRDEDWAYAWKLNGEASEWVLSLIEAHGDQRMTLQQITQFLHYITNPLMLGHRCLCIPAGFLVF